VANAFETKPYKIAYFSTHGKFENNPKDSFLLTYDGELDMDDLKGFVSIHQFRTPVELLTFGACETAAGNELAALGLAGVAVKTGAKSAVGTLWKVPEKSTAQLMARFFCELCDDPTLSKAKALQNAQEWLLDEYRAYPFHWAPFLLIGNWF